MDESISKAFEENFLDVPFDVQVQACERHELAQTIAGLFKTHQPVIDAGCGAGRWVAWLRERRIACDGIDWSRALCERAKAEVPEARFLEGDIRKMPVQDASYGGVLCLGTLEHAVEGPRDGIMECRRVLRNGGVMLLTVPYGGPLRRLRVRLGLLFRLCQSRFGSSRSRGAKPSLAEALAGTTFRWCPRFMRRESGWVFFEYEFTGRQMRQFIIECGFEVTAEGVGFVDEGLLHNIGRLAGRWNAETQGVVLTRVGRILKKALPGAWVGHMLYYVARKR